MGVAETTLPRTSSPTLTTPQAQSPAKPRVPAGLSALWGHPLTVTPLPHGSVVTTQARRPDAQTSPCWLSGSCRSLWGWWVVRALTLQAPYRPDPQPQCHSTILFPRRTPAGPAENCQESVLAPEWHLGDFPIPQILCCVASQSCRGSCSSSLGVWNFSRLHLLGPGVARHSSSPASTGLPRPFPACPASLGPGSGSVLSQESLVPVSATDRSHTWPPAHIGPAGS